MSTDRADLRTLAAEAIDAAIDATGREHGDPQPNGEELVDAVLAAVLPEHRRMVLGEAADALDAFPLTGASTKYGQTARGWFDRAAETIRLLAAAAPPAEALWTEAVYGEHLAELVDRAAAPPDGLSAPVPAENAPAVPEEVDGQRAGQGDGQGWTVTAWRCDCHEWTWTAYFSDLQWFPMNAGLRVYGEQSARTLADLRSAHLNLTPVAVDDVAPLVAERDRLAREVFTLTNSENLDVVAAELERDEARADRDRLARELSEAQTELALVKSRPLFSTRKVMQTLLEALGDPVDEQELILRIDDGLRLADVAQRVIAALALTAAERDVVEAAKAWRGNRYASASILELAAAVDALSDAGTDQTEGDRG